MMFRSIVRSAAGTRQRHAFSRGVTAAASSQMQMVEWVRENGGSVSDAVSISYPNAVAGAGLQASRVSSCTSQPFRNPVLL